MLLKPGMDLDRCQCIITCTTVIIGYNYTNNHPSIEGDTLKNITEAKCYCITTKGIRHSLPIGVDYAGKCELMLKTTGKS